MTLASGEAAPTVAIVGGGLAGLATAVALSQSGCHIELFEARSRLGGRAGSFRDPATGQLVDHCQHVSMGCCTNLADFCRRVEIADMFRRDDTLHFVGPTGRHYPFRAGRLPAPLHLARAFWGLKFLPLADRFRVARALWLLARTRLVDDEQAPTVGQWLQAHGQSQVAIEQFWGLILTSALGEDLDRASLAAARKVFVDGFLAAHDAYAIEIPQAPLELLYGAHLERWLANHGVQVHLSAAVQRIDLDARADPAGGDRHRMQLNVRDAAPHTADFVVLAVPWSHVAPLVPQAVRAAWPWLEHMDTLESAPITGVHLCFDRSIMPWEHAVLPGRLSQWVFHRALPDDSPTSGHYYQVVISASRSLAGRDRHDIVNAVHAELAAIWPQAAEARLLANRVVTERAAVFSVGPGLDRVRPHQQTATPGVLVAGDWTSTGWPSTMEGAVRSGYLAAEAILASLGRPQRWLAPDLPRGWLARRLIR